MELGKQIQAARRFRKMTQQQLADECGVTRQFITHIETERAVPSIHTLQRITTVLGCRLAIILSTPEEVKP